MEDSNDDNNNNPSGIPSNVIWAYINISLGSISALFSIWRLTDIVKQPNKTYTLQILWHILFWNTILSLSIIGSYTQLFMNCIWCAVAGLGTYTISQITYQAWVIALSVYSYQVMTSQARLEQRLFFKKVRLYTIIYMVSLVVIPILIFIIFIKVLWVMFAIFFIVVSLNQALAIFIPLVLYLKQKRYIKRYFDKSLLRAMNIDLSKLFIFPLIQVIASIPTVVNSVLSNWVDLDEDTNSALNGLAGLFYTISGICNAILYMNLKRTLLRSDDKSTIKKNQVIDTRDQESSGSSVLDPQKIDDSFEDSDGMLKKALRD